MEPMDKNRKVYSHQHEMPLSSEAEDALPFFTKLPDFDTKIQPLFEALAIGKGVLYVGAGASIPAGMPGWSALLKMCLKDRITKPEEEAQWQLANQMIDRGDLMLAAEMLQTATGDKTTHQKLIRKIFGERNEPTEVHRMLARVPASICLTTNYDNLLEEAYREALGKMPPTCTWLDKDVFFEAIRQRIFTIVKTHGECDKANSLVLAKSQYYDVMLNATAFNACLDDLLLYRTFLFVGCSLSDEDLLQKMALGKKMFPNSYGPHFAILFDDETDARHSQFLENNYAIHVIVAKKASDVSQSRDEATIAVRNTLLAIRGRVARQILKMGDSGLIGPLEGPLLSVARESARIIEKVVKLTGASRGDVNLVRSPSLQLLHKVAEFEVGHAPKVIPFPVDSDRTTIPTGKTSSNYFSVIQSLFLQKRRTSVYLPDVSADEALEKQGFKNSRYEPCNKHTQSELAASVISDGMHVGVINLESDLLDGFTAGHLKILRAGAEQLGRVFSEARRRSIASRGLAFYCKQVMPDPKIIKQKIHRKQNSNSFERIEAFTDLLRMSRDLVLHDMRFLLFKTDNYTDRLVGYWDRRDKDMFQGKQFTYDFDSKSLAVACARTAKRIPIFDVDQAVTKMEMHLNGVKSFNITGPCEARPVICDGDVAGVLVCWSRDPMLQQPDGYKLFTRMAERAFRVVSLIGNAPPSTIDPESFMSGSDNSKGLDVAGFLHSLNNNLKSIDRGHAWTTVQLKSNSFRQDVFNALLSSLVEESVGIGRVRLWVRVKNEQPEFHCIAHCYAHGYEPSISIPYDELTTSEADPYCAYTVERWVADPYAQPQHRTMFPGFQVDSNGETLQKDPDGEWLVAPIVWDGASQNHENPQLVGFISADCHVPTAEGPKNRQVSASEKCFHQCALDLITHVIATTTMLESVHRVHELRKLSKARK